VEVRNADDGAIVFTLPATQGAKSISGVFGYPFKDENRKNLVVCYSNGEGTLTNPALVTCDSQGVVTLSSRH
jgi:hypothetical protein